MASQPERNDLDCGEVDLLEILRTVRPFLIRYKYCILITPILFALIGFGLSTFPDPQWEATAILQIGRVSPSEFIEPVDRLIMRSGTSDFRQVVLLASRIPLSSVQADLYQSSLSVKPHKVAGVVEIKVRGLSRELALKLSSATVSEICNTHISMIPQVLFGPKRRLAALEKMAPAMAANLTGVKQLPTEIKLLSDIAVSYLASEAWQLKFSLLDQIEFPETHPTVLIDERAGNDPAYPRKSQWIIYWGALGLFLGIVIPLVMNLTIKLTSSN